MLESVGHPVAVHPDEELAEHANRNGWPILR
jgi:phosphoserine phosphatase